MMKNVAVFGCGYWGKNLVRNFHELGALRLVCDISADGRKLAETIASGVETSDDFSAAFRREDIDAVVLATPAVTHAPLAMEAMNNGKDVYVEKPMAMNVKEATMMQEHASRLGRVLMVGHILEYHPAVTKLKSLIQSGELGEIHYIYSNRLNFGKIRIEENALWSFAPHDIAVILRLMDEKPIEVTSVGGAYVTPNLADVTVSGLHFSSGKRAHIFVNWLNPFKEQKLVVVGEERMAVFNDVAKEGKLKVYNQKVDLENRNPILRKGDVEDVEIGNEEPLRSECSHFLECLANREAPLTDGNNGIAVLEVLEACQESLQLNGRPILMSDIRRS